jgi:transposase
MPAPYSLDIRQKVVEAYVNKEGSIRKLAKRFKISKKAVSGFIARFRRTGKLEPKRREVPGNPAKVNEERADYLRELFSPVPYVGH